MCIRDSWVELQKTYYDNNLMRATNRSCKLLMDKEYYDEVIKLCDILGFKHYANNHIHEYKLEAYRQTHQYSLAISYYHKVADMYYGRLGIEVTPLCREIYAEVVQCIASNPVDVDELEQQLKEHVRNEGTFYLSLIHICTAWLQSLTEDQLHIVSNLLLECDTLESVKKQLNRRNTI